MRGTGQPHITGRPDRHECKLPRRESYVGKDLVIPLDAGARGLRHQRRPPAGPGRGRLRRRAGGDERRRRAPGLEAQPQRRGLGGQRGRHAVRVRFKSVVCAASVVVAAPIAGFLALGLDPAGEGWRCWATASPELRAALRRLALCRQLSRGCAAPGVALSSAQSSDGAADGPGDRAQARRSVIAAHKRRAKARGVSLEQQLRDVLAEAAKPSREELRQRLAACRALTPPGPRIAAPRI